MILNKQTFDRIRAMASRVNPMCTSVTYCGGRHDGIVAFRCVHKTGSIAPRAGFKLVVDEQFNTTSIENLISIAGSDEKTFRVTCSADGRNVERIK